MIIRDIEYKEILIKMDDGTLIVSISDEEIMEKDGFVVELVAKEEILEDE